MTIVVTVVALVVVVSMWVTWTAGRLDRLSVRVESAWAALDAQLVRRAAVAGELAAHLRRNGFGDDSARALERAAIAASQEVGPERELLENDLSRAIRALVTALPEPPGETRTAALLGALEAAGTRVAFARQFYNDAVRDDRRLRGRPLPRLLTVRHRHEQRRAFFEIDDTALPAATEPRPV